jgi:hypothetical protein
MAVRALRASIPDAWILREDSKDYGIDCEIEVVGAKGEVSGATIKAQVKGTTQLLGELPSSARIKTTTVRYWCNLTAPVVLVRVAFPNSRVYWLDVREYLDSKALLTELPDLSQKWIPFSFRESHELPHSIPLLADLALEHQDSVLWMRDELDGDLKAYFVGLCVLVIRYDGDIDQWIKYLREEAPVDQLAADLPMVLRIRDMLADDPPAFARVREMVEHLEEFL